MSVLVLGACGRGDPEEAATLVRSPGRDEVTLLLGGDVTLARGISEQIAQAGQGDPAFPYSLIAGRVRAADLAFANFECVLADATAKQAAPKAFPLRAEPALFAGVRQAGFDLVSLANNHTLDFGQQALTTTLRTVRAAEVGALGLQMGPAEHQRPLLARVGQERFAWLGYTAVAGGTPSDTYPRPFPFVLERVVADVRQARGQAQHVVVSVHWGDEYSLVASAEQVAAAHALVDAGAELIVGHHPHVPQEVEEYRGGLIAYSLGNLVFDLTSAFKRERTYRGFLLEVRYRGGRRTGFELVPVEADRHFRPQPAPRLDVASWVRRPVATPYRLSEHLAEARVERGTATGVARCEHWRKRPPRRHAQYLQWLHPRWGCPDDARRPWLTVAATGERSATVFRRGVWAHPHPDGALRLSFSGVPFGARLVGHAGIPDFSLELAKKDPQPLTLVVRAGEAGEAGGAGGARLELRLPFRAGWQPLSLDTAALSGQSGPLTVEVQGGPASESGFVFDLWVEG